MSASINPDIVTDGLVLCLDDKSLMPNNAWRDILLNSEYNVNTYSIAEWANNIEAITICVFVQKTGNGTGFATYPITKMNNGTSNASFRLYHFNDYQGTTPGNEGLFYWYATKNTSWGPIAYPHYLELNEKAFLCLQYNAVDGGLHWKNTSKAANGVRFGSGTLGLSGNGPISVTNPIEGNGFHKLFACSIYNRELQDDEILQNYKALKSRYGL